MGTPVGSSHAESIVGHCRAGAVKRAFGCAALAPVFFATSGVHVLPCQSMLSAVGAAVMPCHRTAASGVIAPCVKMLFLEDAGVACAVVFTDVPGLALENPASR